MASSADEWDPSWILSPKYLYDRFFRDIFFPYSVLYILLSAMSTFPLNPFQSDSLQTYKSL